MSNRHVMPVAQFVILSAAKDLAGLTAPRLEIPIAAGRSFAALRMAAHALICRSARGTQ